SGSAAVYAQELDEDGAILREYDDTPHDFGRIAAMTAKQVILQRLREATDEAHFGEYVGREGDLVTGVIQAHEARTEKGLRTWTRARAGRGVVTSTWARSRRCCPRPNRCPASCTNTVSGSSVWWCTWPRASVARRSRCPARTPTSSRSSSRSRSPRSRTAAWRSPPSRARRVTEPRSPYARWRPA